MLTGEEYCLLHENWDWCKIKVEREKQKTANRIIDLKNINVLMCQKWNVSYLEISSKIFDYYPLVVEEQLDNNWKQFCEKGVDKKAEDLIRENGLDSHMYEILKEISKYFQNLQFSVNYFIEPEDESGNEAIIIKIFTGKYDSKHYQTKKAFQHNWFYSYLSKNNIKKDIVISLY